MLPTNVVTPTAAGIGPQPALPPLEAGDRLDRTTFHQRYRAMPESFRAELLGGMVVVPSPTSKEHSSGQNIVACWLEVYRAATPGTFAGSNGTVFLSDDSEVQPDVALLILPEHGGQTRVEGQFFAGAPEFVAEIASSSESYDLHLKYQAYEAAGVREYVVVRLRQREVDWFALAEGRFARRAPDAEGLLRSHAFPGLWLSPLALVEGRSADVLATLQRGLATSEHAVFVAELAKRGGTT